MFDIISLLQVNRNEASHEMQIQIFRQRLSKSLLQMYIYIYIYIYIYNVIYIGLYICILSTKPPNQANKIGNKLDIAIRIRYMA